MNFEIFKRLSLLIVTLCAILAWSAPGGLKAQDAAPAAQGTEQILSYNSDITVNPDSTLLVQEAIKVFAAGAKIKYGIYRDFPTRYTDRFSNSYAIHADVVSVERDGQPEEFHLERMANGLRIYMGRSGHPVSTGEHTYELTYAVDRELGFFQDHDELYWNATGNGWIFPVQAVSATVHLPGGIARGAILLDAYTGRQGSVQSEFTAYIDAQSNGIFQTTRPLGPYEGLTIVARWPKRFVHPPTDEQKHQYFLEDNQPSLLGILGLVIALIYYAGAWLLAGRGPSRGEIKPRTEPPRGFSPAALCYAWRRGFDQKAMVANLVDLAVKKQVAILEDTSGTYILGRLKVNAQSAGSSSEPTQEVTADEKLVANKLFGAGDTIRLEPLNRTQVGGAVEALHYHLRSQMEKTYFMSNAPYLIPGMLISVATLIRCGYEIQGGQRTLLAILIIGLLLWSMGCLTLAKIAIGAWRNALSDPHHARTARNQAMLTSAICIPAFIGEVAGLWVFAWAATPEIAGVLILLVAINYGFHNLLKAPTLSGRALLNQVEGFRVFLTTTVQDPRDAHTSLKITPEVFERFLGYAMALNVEKVWGERFAAALAQSGHGEIVNYTPEWYSGTAWNRITAATFATSLASSFSSAISSSTAAPGLKSGGSVSSVVRGGGARGR